MNRRNNARKGDFDCPVFKDSKARILNNVEDPNSLIEEKTKCFFSSVCGSAEDFESCFNAEDVLYQAGLVVDFIEDGTVFICSYDERFLYAYRNNGFYRYYPATEQYVAVESVYEILEEAEEGKERRRREINQRNQNDDC